MGEVVPLSATRDPLRALVARKSALLSRARADARRSDAEYRVYAAALDWTHRDLDEHFGKLWPSVSRLARDAGGKARRTVQCALTKFVLMEYLHLVSDRRGGRRKVPKGAAASTFYALPGIGSSGYRAADVPVNSAADVPVNSAADVPVNSAADVPQSYREEPMEETLRVSRARGAKGSRLRESVGSRLAPDWEASSEDVLLAEQLGLDAAAIALRFRDYWIAVPDPKGRKADWSATWRNWCRKEAESRAAPGGFVTAIRTAAAAGPLQGSGSVVVAAHRALAAGPLARPREHNQIASEIRIDRIPVSDDEWRRRIEVFQKAGGASRDWPRIYGLPPTHIATDVPRHLRKEFGY